MDFVAIDFETANEKRNSACSLGIAVVKDSKIEEVKYWLIKPYEMRFVSMNVWIHGIVEEDVENQPKMDKLWDEIKPYLESNFVVAHNASFDMSVLRNTLDCYGIEYPEFDYSCTMVMSKNSYEYLPNYKLNTIADHIGIKFKHHHAGEDAEACAKILLNICDKFNIKTVDELKESLELKIGKVYKDGYVPAGTHKKRTIRNKKVLDKKIEEVAIREHIGTYSSHLLSNKTIVFTGPLQSMTRTEAMKKVRNMGGLAGSSVTKKTNYLVVGIKNSQKLSDDRKSTKLRKAEINISKGQDIKIISEEEFLKMVN